MKLYAHMPIIRDILLGASREGASLEKLCLDLGIKVADLNDSEKYADFETSCRAWSESLKQTGNKFLGLRIGQRSSPAIVGLIGHLMESGPTIGEAFDALCKFNAVVTNMMIYSHRNDQQLYITSYAVASGWKNNSPDTASQAVDQSLIGTIRVFEQLSGKPVYPLAVKLERKRKSSEYEKLFGCHVTFNATKNELIFPKDIRDMEVTGYDRSLYALFDELLKKRRNSLQQSVNVANQVKAILIHHFNGQPVTIDVVAAYLNMTTRSLQRALSTEGYSYRTLSNDLKGEMATQLLQSSDKIEQIAYVLGYSDVSAFRRAFKNWKKIPPAKFRKDRIKS